jgi:capsular polysaccharide synthesis protein
MKRTIWSCWLQGREAAPPLVKGCFSSWERENPGWDFRCLDADSIECYVNLKGIVDLQSQSLTAASLSDIVRILLLHEFGGIWVDATLFCNRPLDEWLPNVMTEGFFAFAEPDPDRLLSSWFLSAVPGNYVVSNWCRRTIAYWSNRRKAEDCFWFDHLFGDMYNADEKAAKAWSRVPKINANGPYALQFDGLMYRFHGDVIESVDWTTPVFKLTHRLPDEGLRSESLLDPTSAVSI